MGKTKELSLLELDAKMEKDGFIVVKREKSSHILMKDGFEFMFRNDGEVHVVIQRKLYNKLFKMRFHQKFLSVAFTKEDVVAFKKALKELEIK